MATRIVASRLSRPLTATKFLPRNSPSCSCLRQQPPQSLASFRGFSISTRHLEKKFTKEHEWVELSSDGSIGTIGISAYAANALGDVVYVELPTVDDECSTGDVIAAVESVKSASDILAPVSGTIAETNAALEDKPATLNQSPEGDAWIAKIKLSDPGELAELMDAAAYKKFTEEPEDE